MARRLLGTLVLLLLTLPLTAHPHVWADVKAEVTISAGYVEGVWAEWTFDDVFSQLILADFPPDKAGKIPPETNAAIKKGYFDNLKVYQYFSHVGLGAKTLPIPPPQDFLVRLSPDGRVIYRFFLPLALRLDAKTPLCVSFYDDTFFTDMVFEKAAPVTLKLSDGGKATSSLKPDKTKTYYGGQVTPTYAVIDWRPQ